MPSWSFVANAKCYNFSRFMIDSKDSEYLENKVEIFCEKKITILAKQSIQFDFSVIMKKREKTDATRLRPARDGADVNHFSTVVLPNCITPNCITLLKLHQF